MKIYLTFFMAVFALALAAPAAAVDNNSIFIQQTGAATNYAVTQTGNDEMALIDQKGVGLGGLYASIAQSGSHNSATISQEGLMLVASITQTGADNQASIRQTGENNIATVVQTSMGNIASLIQSVYQHFGSGVVVDGYGFHEGFFHWQRYIQGQPAPARLEGYARRAFDQGFGRCLWFIDGGDVTRIPQTISTFPAERRADLWSGVGLAVTYAGEVSQSELAGLSNSAGECWPCLAQGAAFAAKARLRAQTVVPYTDRATIALCGLPVAQAAQVTDDALQGLPPDSAEPAYEIWRQRVQTRLA